MDGSTFTRTVQISWTGPHDPRHPHQLWLQAGANDRAGNFDAFKAACPELSDDVCAEVFALHDSAQYHFITALLWDRSFGSEDSGDYMSVEEALATALEEHQKVVKDG